MDYCSKQDLQDYRNYIESLNLSSEIKKEVAIKSLAHGLFKMKIENTGSLHYDMLKWCFDEVDKLPLTKRINSWEFILKAIYQEDKDFIEKFFITLLNHLVDGTDTSDAKSAGGWNKEELQQFVEIIELTV